MHTITINGINFTLTDLEKDCWLRILNGSLRSKDAFHTPAMANTVDGQIHLRTVVLRKVNPQQKTVAIHTDIRSKKWQNLATHKNISLLFYDAAARIQIRLGGEATLHNDDDIANLAWQNTSANSRKTYLTEKPPSSICEEPSSGLIAQFEKNNLTIEETEVGKANFGVIKAHINYMEWLWLNSAGHRRAVYHYQTDNSFNANWIIP
jgi:pyridoxamine 5'-phosphate oxidase